MSPYVLVPILIGLWAMLFAYVLTRSNGNILRERLKKNGSQTSFASAYHALVALLKPVSTKNLENSKSKDKIRVFLQALGSSSTDEDIIEFENTRLFTLLIVFVFCAILLFVYFNTTSVSVAIFFCYIAYKYPEFKVQKLVAKRRQEFLRYFPDAIDLLSVCVEAGLGIDAAIERVALEFGDLSSAVSSEFGRLAKDTMSGLSREDALKNMSNRVKSQDLQSFAALLIQSEKMGTSIAQSLKVYCETLRTRKKQRIQELVQSASAKMTIPMILFLIPALFLVILYPAVIKIMENMVK